MRIGICTNPETFSAAAEAGFAYVETSITPFAVADEATFRQLRDQVLSVPIALEACACFFPWEMKIAGPNVDSEAIRRYMRETLRRVHELGARVQVFGSGGPRSAPDGWPRERAWEQLVETATMAADIAADYDITIAVEPLCPSSCNIFITVEQGIALVDRINHPHCRLLADLFHVTASTEPFAHIVTAGKRLAHIHTSTPALPQVKPGEMHDFPGYFVALRRAGYNGRVSVEDNNGLLAGIDPHIAYPAIREFVEALV